MENALVPLILPNGLLAVGLGLYVLLDRRLSALLAATLMYCTAHFSLGVWVLFTASEPREALVEMRQNPVPEVRAWGLAFVLFVMAVIAWRYRAELGAWLRLGGRRSLLGATAACAVASLLGLALTAWTTGGLTALALKDVASMLLMLVLTLLFAVAFSAEREAWREALGRLLRVVSVLAVLATLVALFELNTGQTRANTELADGTVVDRASSLLYDPNLFGMWCAAVAIFAGRFLFRGAEGRWASVALVFAGAGLLFSGSRSGLILYLSMSAVLFAHGVRHGGLRRLSTTMPPVALAGGGLLVTGLLASLLERAWSAAPYAVGAVALLSERMLRLPLEVGEYFLARMGPRLGIAPPEPEGGGYDPTAMSIEGRFQGNVPDNGYLATLDAAGPLGLLALIGLLLWVAFLAFRWVWPQPDEDSGYGLACGLGCVLSALFLRTFQVFPLWVFLAIGLSGVFAAVLHRWEVKGRARADKTI